MDRPERINFDNQKDYGTANRKFAEQIAGLAPKEDELPEIKEGMNLLTRRVLELEEIVSRCDKVHLEAGEYVISAGDHLTLALAAIMASRGQRVDLPLRDGTVISNLRIGELVQIANQLYTPGALESDAPYEPS